jgi:hypothetical protein
MPVKREITLGPPELAAKAAVDEDWFDNETTNRLMGHGKGEIGSMKAVVHLAEAITGNNPALKLMGFYCGTEPVGLFWVEYKGDNRRTAEIHLTASDKPATRRAFYKAGIDLINLLFSNGVYRVEAEPLRINKGMIKFLRHGGFKQEGIKRSAYWMDNNDYDTVLLRMLRREWTRKEN